MNTSEALEAMIKLLLSKKSVENLARFISPDFCLDDIADKNPLGFLRIVGQLADLQGHFVESVTFHRIPPAAPDVIIGYFSISLSSPANYIKKCDGDHAGAACRD